MIAFVLGLLGGLTGGAVAGFVVLRVERRRILRIVLSRSLPREPARIRVASAAAATAPIPNMGWD